VRFEWTYRKRFATPAGITRRPIQTCQGASFVVANVFLYMR
jgi:hypothetical protein